jgi:ATP synthase protein I
MTARRVESDGMRRPDMRATLDRDLQRYSRRDPSSRSFWRSLGVLGAVGWPVAIATVGGALLGRWIDARLGTGLQFTLGLLAGGAVAGAGVAWHLIHGRSQ